MSILDVGRHLTPRQFIGAAFAGLSAGSVGYVLLLWQAGYWSWVCLCDIRP